MRRYTFKPWVGPKPWDPDYKGTWQPEQRFERDYTRDLKPAPILPVDDMPEPDLGDGGDDIDPRSGP